MGRYRRKFLENRKKLSILTEREFGSISELVNWSQQLLGIFLLNLAVILPRYHRLTSLFSFSKCDLFSELRQVKVVICTLIRKIPLLFVDVYGPKFMQFSTLVKHMRVCLTLKFDGGGGYRRKFWEIAKKPFFTLVHVKALTVLTFRGQRSRSNIYLSTGSRAVLSVQKFASILKLWAPKCRRHSRFFSF